MKVKTIKKVLDKKFQDWLQSITDPVVRDLAARNSLISGGCIASMLLREKVNDYDIYFTNKETVLAIARYYAAQSNVQATVVDVDNLSDYPKDGELSREYAKEHGIFGAGRVAIYCEANKQDQADDTDDLEMAEALGTVQKIDDPLNEEKYRLQFISPNAISLSNKVQLIIRFYGTPEEIHANFDFVHAVNYWVAKNDKGQSELVLNQKSLESILSRQMIYVGSKYPLASVLRTKKFLLRGWTIDAGQYLKMLLQCNDLNLLVWVV